MGTTFVPGYTREQVIADATRPWETDTKRYRFVDRGGSGNQVWLLGERTDKVTGEQDLEIILLLMTKSGGDWGYKDMSEAMGPYYYDVPQRFLDAAPVTNPEWRRQVRDHQDAKRRRKEQLGRLRVGSIVTLRSGAKPNRLRIVRLKPLAGEDERTGEVYRIPKTYVVAVD